VGDEDISPLREGAINLHEWYIELINAGFKRSEAMELIAKVMSEHFRGQ
jgi:hypothetical protein